MKRRRVRERDEADAREQADRRMDELLARLKGSGESPPAVEQEEVPAVVDKTPKKPPKKKKPKK
jgi:hypothetical protein